MSASLVPLLVFVAVVSLGGAALVGGARRKRTVRRRLEPLGHSPHGEKSPASPWLRTLSTIGAWVAADKPSPMLKEKLANAGYHGRNAAAVYLGAKMLLLTAGAVGVAVALLATGLDLTTRLLLVALAGGGMSFVPNVFVHSQCRRRRQQMREFLPDALDLLEICVSSGMGLDMAWVAVSDEIRRVCPPLADEMALTSLEIHLGASRATAMRHMAERTAQEELSSLVAVLVQSDRFGTSVAEALRTFASSMREARGHRAQETAEKMAVKLILPMVLFIFPAVLIVMIGPAAVTLKEMLGS